MPNDINVDLLTPATQDEMLADMAAGPRQEFQPRTPKEVEKIFRDANKFFEILRACGMYDTDPIIAFNVPVLARRMGEEEEAVQKQIERIVDANIGCRIAPFGNMMFPPGDLRPYCLVWDDDFAQQREDSLSTREAAAAQPTHENSHLDFPVECKLNFSESSGTEQKLREELSEEEQANTDPGVEVKQPKQSNIDWQVKEGSIEKG